MRGRCATIMRRADTRGDSARIAFVVLGKRIEQAFDDLEQRKVGVAQGIADEMRVAVGIACEESFRTNQDIFVSVPDGTTSLCACQASGFCSS